MRIKLSSPGIRYGIRPYWTKAAPLRGATGALVPGLRWDARPAPLRAAPRS